MATCSGICGIEITCPDGCGVLCTSDCEDCTQWCEPTTVETAGVALPVGVLTRVGKPGGNVHVHVGAVDYDEPRHPADTQFKIQFHDISNEGLARLLSTMSPHSVKAPTSIAAERQSGSGSGTIAELAAQFSLVVE
ncbi:hypothetical protein [Nocardia sp. NPDC005825]|uniref:hypothetical protein n=1 Tax=unclassified Nocardia TaxID=2637762 RepID=UPI0034119806